MITTEQWLLQLTQSSHLAHTTCQQLWQIFTTTLSNRLIQSRPTYIRGVGLWYVEMHAASIALLPSGERYLIPPRVLPRIEMDDKPLSVDDIGELLSKSSGQIPNTVAQFYDALVSLFSMHEERGHDMEWSGLGTFSPIDRGDTKCYAFTPDEELLNKVNRPYQMFTPTPVKDGVSWSDLKTIEVENIEALPYTIHSLRLRPTPSVESEQTIVEPEPELLPTITEEPIVAETIEATEPAPEQEISTPPRPDHKKLIAWSSGIIAVLVGIFLAWYLGRDRQTPTNLVDSTTIVADASPTGLTDSTSTKTAKRSDILTTVTVEPGKFLTRYAKEYLGSSYFWIYIYYANEDKIDDPDNLTIGSTLIIPTPESLGIMEVNKESIDKAKDLALRYSLDHSTH